MIISSIALLPFLSIAGQIPSPGTIVSNSLRFTVVTPECIRIETAGSDGKFVDLPSMFAANREARFTKYRLTRSSDRLIIDTGAIRLTYRTGHRQFDPSDLEATIRKGTKVVRWMPGKENKGNLGGTVRTLDGADGPMNLGEGVISRDGWYLLDDSKSDLLTTDWVEMRPRSAGRDWYLFGYGDDYRGALKSLTTIGGPVPLPRKYLLGTWYSRYWPYTSNDYRNIVQEYRDHDFPIDNMVMDMDWHTDGWTGWTWNRQLLPDAEKLLSDFHQDGLHVTLNVHPADGVAPKEEMYAKFMRDMGQDPASGKTLPFDAGDKKYLDTMFADTHDPLTKEGVDFWWLDWQQYPFTRSIPDLTNLAWLNHYYFGYTSKNGQRGVSFSRWAGWGDHRYPIHFSGDASTSWRMLSFEVPMTATAGNVGCFFWSHDIGGHNRGRNEESYARWCQFGALSAALRSHSTRDKSMDRRPWTYPKWAEDSMRQSFHLRSELFPYIYTSAAESARDSVPLTRPLYFDSPGDENAYHNGQEYMYGDNLLVAPITMPGVGPSRVGRQVVYFPKGTWFNTMTGERYFGPTEKLISADINEFPLFARAGTPVPMQPYSERMATANLTTLRIRCFPGESGKSGSSSVYEDDGVTDLYKKHQSASTALSYSRKGSEVTIKVDSTQGSYTGQVDHRDIQIELPDTLRPIGATANGHPVEVEYDQSSFTTKIRVKNQSIREELKVVVKTQAKGFDYSKIAMTAAIRRLSGVLGEDLPETARLSDLAVRAAEVSDPKTREAALAVLGIGVVDKSEAPYLYQGTHDTSFYSPNGLIDHDRFTPIFLSQDDEAKEVPLRKGQNILSSPKTEGTAIGASFQIQSKSISIILGNDDRYNVARQAKVTVSSIEPGYGKEGLTDGVIDGYPGNSKAEWSSNQLVGAWCTLTWDKPQTINRIRLFDRPNENDHILSGILTFSDGTTLPVSALPNDGQTPLELSFPPKTVSWVKFEVTGVSPESEHAGLSEFQVFSVGSSKVIKKPGSRG